MDPCGLSNLQGHSDLQWPCHSSTGNTMKVIDVIRSISSSRMDLIPEGRSIYLAEPCRCHISSTLPPRVVLIASRASMCSTVVFGQRPVGIVGNYVYIFMDTRLLQPENISSPHNLCLLPPFELSSVCPRSGALHADLSSHHVVNFVNELRQHAASYRR